MRTSLKNHLTDDAARTSIVVVADDDSSATRSCVDAIEQHTSFGSYEFIVCMMDDSEAVNAAIASTSYDNVLILSSHVSVTEGYLEAMLAALHSAPDVGAVGPMMEGVPGQNAYACYPLVAPDAESPSDVVQVDKRLRLSSKCLLLKREVLDSVGSFDEQYAASSLRDDDLSFRIVMSDRTLLLVRSVSVLNSSIGREEGTAEERRRFAHQWGIDPTYSSIQRSEVVALLESHRADSPLTVLELGCAAGATLIEIQNRFPNAEIYGIEKNEGAVAIGRHFADVRSTDVENGLDYPEDFFDYVITADILEHLLDPWQVVASIRPHLKQSGKLIASIPNIMHFSVMRGLVNGSFTYQDAGILDRTHLRFFTLGEIDRLFASAGYGQRSYSATTIPATDDDLVFVRSLKDLATINASDQFLAYQYLASVDKEPA